MKASDVMSEGVITITPATSVPEIAKLLVKHRISAVPVVDPGGKLVGIVTEGDLIRRSELGTGRERRRLAEFFATDYTKEREYIRSHALTAGDIMSTEMVEVGPDKPLTEIVDLFERNGIKRVPVVVDGAPIGVVSRRDLMRTLASVAGEKRPTIESDHVLRRAILDELSRQHWWRYNRKNVVVKAGVAHFGGLVSSPTESAVLRVAAEQVPDIRGVHDHTVMALSPIGV